jgi:adenylate cyclase
MMRLSDYSRCFQGVLPSLIVTADAQGIPNVAYLSQIHLLDDRHIALSRQFFNKTARNLDENPRATIEVPDPLTMQAYRLRIRFIRSEKSGALFDSMAMRIQAIASHTGMTGIFRLIAADIFEVESFTKVENFLTEVPADPKDTVSVEGVRSEIRGLQLVAERINRADSLDILLDGVLESLDAYFGFEHTMILLEDETTKRLVMIASRGYSESGVGAEVEPGEGLIGMVARERKLLRISGLAEELRYSRAAKREGGVGAPEIPLPSMPDAQSALVIPLMTADRLVGVIAAFDRDPMRFGEWHEAYLEILAGQIAMGIERMLERMFDRDEDVPAVAPPARAVVPADGPRRTLTYYRNDDCIFVDGEYLIRNVPGRILWKLLVEWQREGRTEFSNRELRLDPSLGLPAVKDNLESRLILLRKRLDEKLPELKIESTGRGRFALRVGAAVEMVER